MVNNFGLICLCRCKNVNKRIAARPMVLRALLVILQGLLALFSQDFRLHDR